MGTYRLTIVCGDASHGSADDATVTADDLVAALQVAVDLPGGDGLWPGARVRVEKELRPGSWAPMGQHDLPGRSP